MIYFIATKHAEYLERTFAPGDIVIDPFRYIPSRVGVKVRSIGRNQPELISILCPTRGRPRLYERMVESAFETATFAHCVEFIGYLDRDDEEIPEPNVDFGMFVRGDQILLSETWNRCYEAASGEILMHCGDDVVFRTPGWDVIVREAFRQVPDRIVLVHGDDCSPNTDALATHGFYHRRWIETLGYFMPPYFSSDWNDVWLTEVADLIGRRVKVPIVTEHMHYSFGKAEYDLTYRQREERGIRDGVVSIFERTKKNRQADAAKLQAAMT